MVDELMPVVVEVVAVGELLANALHEESDKEDKAVKHLAPPAGCDEGERVEVKMMETEYLADLLA